MKERQKPKKLTTVSLSEYHLEKLELIKKKWGVPIPELIRFAIYDYFASDTPNPVMLNVMRDLETLVSKSHRISEQHIMVNNHTYIYRSEIKKWVCIT